MIIETSFNKNIEESIRRHWSLSAFSDYGDTTFQYCTVAESIAKLHVLFKETGIEKGDKIAICGRNMSRWGMCFLASLTYGAVAVPILHEFHPDQIHHIVNHCDAKILFVGDQTWAKLNPAEMPSLLGVIQINDFTLLSSNDDKFKEVASSLNLYFGKHYPSSFGKEDIHYHEDQSEELAIINYTSGTTSNSKGVMIPFRAVIGNMLCGQDLIGDKIKPGDCILSMLPMAHTYGMSFEFLYEFIEGVHVHFLTRMPTPSILLKALREIKPVALVCVPLIIEKVVRKAVMEKLKDPKMRVLLNTPVVGRQVKNRIRDGIKNAFGGKIYEVVIGGAALNQEVEALLYDIGFCYTVGYGATECAPLIACEDWTRRVKGSCGKAMNRMKIEIDSTNPYEIPGEILVKGQNVMLGYYKNPEATAETLRDGWYHTGDLGVIDRDGNLFIKGRIKNMLLSSNGQNIYPEEIEDKLQNLDLVQESLVIQRKGKLLALVYPNQEEIAAREFTPEQVADIMENNRKTLNGLLAAYEQVSEMEIRKEEFEKTPKRSIKRYLYK